MAAKPEYADGKDVPASLVFYWWKAVGVMNFMLAQESTTASPVTLRFIGPAGNRVYEPDLPSHVAVEVTTLTGDLDPAIAPQILSELARTAAVVQRMLETRSD